MIRSFELNELTGKDPWDSVLATTMFVVQTTVHTVLQATPTKIVIGQDAILNIPFKVDGKLIQMCKQALIKK